jgi:hypothetical protein
MARSPKRVLIAQLDFVGKLREVGLGPEADRAFEIFRYGEAWGALNDRDLPEERMRDFSAQSMVTGNLIVCALAASVFCAMFWLVGAYLVPRVEARARPHQLVVAVVAIALAALGWVLTGSGLVALVTAGVVGLLVFVPAQLRTQPPGHFGPFFEFSAGLLGAVFGFLGAVLVAHGNLSTQVVLATVGESYDLGRSIPGLMVIVVCMLAGVAGVWSLAQRVSSLVLLAHGLRIFGLVGTVSALATAIVGGPVAVLYDRYLASDMNEIVSNEPGYYLNR